MGNKEGKLCLIKIDTAGEIVWNKAYPSLTGIASKVIVLNDNSIVVSSYQNNEIEPITNLPAINSVFIQKSYGLPNLYCTIYYEIGDIDGYNVKSETNLTKLDKEGNILWSNNYEECIGKGNSIIKNSNGNINLVTLKLKGRVPILVFDGNGVFQDTINYPEDDSTLCLYEIASDGNTLWKKEIKHIYNTGYDHLTTSIDVQQTNNNLLVKTEKNTIFFNGSGDVINTFVNHYEHCNNVNSILSGKDDAILISGCYVTIDTIYIHSVFNNYIQRLDDSQNIIWESQNDEILLDNSDGKFITLTSDSTMIKIYDNNGSELWNFSSPASEESIINCNDGLTSVKSENGQLVVTRTNGSGEY